MSDSSLSRIPLSTALQFSMKKALSVFSRLQMELRLSKKSSASSKNLVNFLSLGYFVVIFEIQSLS